MRQRLCLTGVPQPEGQWRPNFVGRLLDRSPITLDEGACAFPSPLSFNCVPLVSLDPKIGGDQSLYGMNRNPFRTGVWFDVISPATKLSGTEVPEVCSKPEGYEQTCLSGAVVQPKLFYTCYRFWLVSRPVV